MARGELALVVVVLATIACGEAFMSVPARMPLRPSPAAAPALGGRCMVAISRSRAAPPLLSLSASSYDSGSSQTQDGAGASLRENKLALARARKLKQEAKMAFFDFGNKLTADSNALKNAKAQLEDLSWVPVYGDNLEEDIKTLTAKVEQGVKEIETRRSQAIAAINSAEIDIARLQERIERVYETKYMPLKASIESGKFTNKLKEVDQIVERAEQAYMAGRTYVAAKILEDERSTFDKLGVFPDSKAPATSANGRLYDLTRCLDSGVVYSTDASFGTQQVVEGWDSASLADPVDAITVAGGISSVALLAFTKLFT